MENTKPIPWTVYHFASPDNKPTERGLFEIEEINIEVNDLYDREKYDQAEDVADNVRDRIAQIPVMEAEIKRLRDNLQNIADNTCCAGCQEAARVARAALA
jgi:hypothetical protein